MTTKEESSKELKSLIEEKRAVLRKLKCKNSESYQALRNDIYFLTEVFKCLSKDVENIFLPAKIK